tara:strand:- start:2750 stop:2995 length:246 start_codon:yes stop_codon:yes gene_type:complete
MKKLILISLILTLSSCMVSQKAYDEQVNLNNVLLKDIKLQHDLNKEQEEKYKTLTNELNKKKKCCELKNDTIVPPHDPAND